MFVRREKERYSVGSFDRPLETPTPFFGGRKAIADGNVLSVVCFSVSWYLREYRLRLQQRTFSVSYTYLCPFPHHSVTLTHPILYELSYHSRVRPDIVFRTLFRLCFQCRTDRRSRWSLTNSRWSVFRGWPPFRQRPLYRMESGTTKSWFLKQNQISEPSPPFHFGRRYVGGRGRG